MNEGFYWYRQDKLREMPEIASLPGLEAWASIAYAFRKMLIDATGLVRTPIKTIRDSEFDIPDMQKSAELSFEECCARRVAELLAAAKAGGQKVNLMFSGGIDSTMVASAFLLFAPLEELKDRVVIVTSTESWTENPSFVREHLVPYFEFQSAARFIELPGILVTGEMNDYYLPGSREWKMRGRGDPEEPYSIDAMIRHLISSGVAESHAKIWAPIFDRERSHSPAELRTLSDMIWWVRFNWARQSYKYQFVMSAAPGAIPSKEALDARVHHFFGSKEFRAWGMRNTDRSPKKNACRKLIARVSDDAQWLQDKDHFSSLRLILRGAKNAVAIDSDFGFKYDLSEILQQYDPKNDFV